MAPRADRRDVKVVASNRRARYDFDILDTFECGIMLVGSEVKSLRDAKVQLADAYARVIDGEVWLHGVHIAPYAFAQGFGSHAADRERKLLLHREEIDRLKARIDQDRLVLVPLALYFKEGRAKVELALARGRRHADRRHAIAERDAKRETERAMAARRRQE